MRPSRKILPLSKCENTKLKHLILSCLIILTQNFLNFKVWWLFLENCWPLVWEPLVKGKRKPELKFKKDSTWFQGRGDERERQQREQLSSMERKVESSIREADATENKLELMEAIIKKLKVGSEEVYIRYFEKSRSWISFYQIFVTLVIKFLLHTSWRSHTWHKVQRPFFYWDSVK